MKTASWIVATHFRPRLLRACLESINASIYPSGWRHEVIVVHHEADAEGAVVATELGAVTIPTASPTGGAKRNLALQSAQGDLILVADDDDCHSPARANAAIAAFEAGYAMSEVREFRYLHLASGNVVRWCGRGSPGVPGVICGTARSYRKTLLQRVGGWKPLPRLIEKDLQGRINARLPARSARAVDLSGELADQTIAIQHASNTWGDRPDLPRGATHQRGEFLLVGEGHWSVAPRFPTAVAERLGLS